MWLSRLATKSSKRSSGLLGLIVGNDRRLSTSLFQFLWTVVIVFCYGGLIAWSCGLIGGSDIVDAVTKAVTHAGACYMPTAPTNIFLVMGFSVVTLAMAKGITTTYVNRGLTSKEPATTPKFSDLLCDDDGNPDLSKIQLLTWTFIGAFTYVGHVFGMLVANNSDRNSFPDIDQSLMILMGIGSGAYLGMTVVSSSSLTLASLTPARAKVGATVSIKVSGFGTTIGTVVFGDTVAEIAEVKANPPKPIWSDTEIYFVVPETSGAKTDYAPGDTVNVGVLISGTEKGRKPVESNANHCDRRTEAGLRTSAF